MRKEYSQYIKKYFREKLNHELLGFSPVSKKTLDLGDFVFLKEMKNSWCAISLQNNRYEDTFRINLDWSILPYEKYMYTPDNNPVISSIITVNKLKIYQYELFRATLIDLIIQGDSWWFIDKEGKALEAIQKYGHIPEEVSRSYFDTVRDNTLYDEATLNKTEISYFIDPLVDNAVELIDQYAIPIFNYLDEQVLVQKVEH